MSGHHERVIDEALARALNLTEEALSQVVHIAIGQIRDGLEAGNHVQAAERDLRSSLCQLVLAERELGVAPSPPTTIIRPAALHADSSADARSYRPAMRAVDERTAIGELSSNGGKRQ